MSWYIMLASICVCVVAIALILCTYKGAYDSLSSATVGNVYNFIYVQPLNGTYERHLAKVIAKRTLSDKELNKLNFFSDYRVLDDNFVRTPTLITCKLMNGNIRSFYAERARLCRRSKLTELLYRFS